jgi:hypothetical protein
MHSVLWDPAGAGCGTAGYVGRCECNRRRSDEAIDRPICGSRAGKPFVNGIAAAESAPDATVRRRSATIDVLDR